MTVSACKEEKKPEPIVAKIPVKTTKPAGPQKRPASHWNETVEWLGQSYSIAIDRTPDSTLVTNDAGQRYYDNQVAVKVTRADGSTFFEKTFRKSSFGDVVKGESARGKALLGMVFDHAQGETLIFGASVGDPNPDSEDFISLSITLTNRGTIAVSEASLGVEDDAAMD